MMPRIRLGMVGGGQGAFIGAVHRIAARLDDHYVLLAGALSADPERARASGAELGLDPARAYDSYEAMFAAERNRPDGIEAVAIVTPNNMHFPIAKAALAAGLHVICDKPLTTNAAEAAELERLAAGSGRVFAVTYNYSAYPLIRHARALVASGRLGDAAGRAGGIRAGLARRAARAERAQAGGLAHRSGARGRRRRRRRYRQPCLPSRLLRRRGSAGGGARAALDVRARAAAR